VFKMEDVREMTRVSSDSEASAAAHARAVMTVKLTLLLLIFGAALFLLDSYGGTGRAGQARDASAGRLK
jgi:hypothetical protein